MSLNYRIPLKFMIGDITRQFKLARKEEFFFRRIDQVDGKKIVKGKALYPPSNH